MTFIIHLPIIFSKKSKNQFNHNFNPNILSSVFFLIKKQNSHKKLRILNKYMGHRINMINEDINRIKKEQRLISQASPNSKVMVVDDQPLSLLHTVDLINYEGYEVVETNNSNEAFSLVYQEQPDIILIDLFMPGINGLELSQQLKREPKTRQIPILLMSVTDDYEVRQQAITIGVDDILQKPLERTSLHCKLRTLAQQKRLNEHLSQTQKVLFSIASAIENRSVDKNQPSFNLPNLLTSFAQYLGLNHDDTEDLKLAAYLHDIGTVSISEEILTKKAQLTPAEQELIRQHVIIGEEICKPFSHRPNLLAIIRHHHEKYDGSGYPDALVGDEIPYLAQVFQIVDIYHALTSKRAHKPAYSSRNSLAILEEETKKGWRNPIILKQFNDFLAIKKFHVG
jgi:putative two-component system response regulator